MGFLLLQAGTETEVLVAQFLEVAASLWQAVGRASGPTHPPPSAGGIVAAPGLLEPSRLRVREEAPHCQEQLVWGERLAQGGNPGRCNIGVLLSMSDV